MTPYLLRGTSNEGRHLTPGTSIGEAIGLNPWSKLLNRTAIEQTVGGKAILITGAGGSIGSALTMALRDFRPRQLILLDHSERNLNQVVLKLNSTSDSCPFSAVLGSISDLNLLLDLFDRYRPEIVYHAAAFKHVPLMESNPLAAVQNNGLASYALAKVSRAQSVSNLVMVSTDKAVNPISIMGASKRVAELAFASLADANTRMSVIRLGNVLGTEGSVVPLFLNQISRGGPVTVTHPEVSRYFLTLDEAIELILLTSSANPSGVFIPRVTEAINIRQMASELIKNSQSKNHNTIEVSFTGLRPGDKLSEEFLYSNEKVTPTDDPRLLRVLSIARDVDDFEIAVERLSNSVEARDIPSTLKAIRRLVPEYRPTDTVTRISQGSPA
jgi:FlaA1/EpsC-like NDP-sugar epimerase